MTLVDNRPPDDERTLVRQAIRGNGEAFGVLYERYLPAIYRYLYFRVGDDAQAEDMTEEVFIKAWEAMPKYKPTKHPFKSWLYRIAHNLFIDMQRKPEPVTLPDEAMKRKVDSQPLPEEAMLHQFDMEKLSEAIQMLDEIEQQVILLRFLEGLSHREVGHIIGKSEQTSRVVQHRALNTLYALLNKELRAHG